MTKNTIRLKPGPFETSPWPNKLTANVVDNGDTVKIQGYSLCDDLAQHYSFVEMAYLTLVGELATAQQTQALELALRLWSAISIAEAPAHAASLARICGTSNSATIGIAATVLAEQGRDVLQRNQGWLDFLRHKQQHIKTARPAPSSKAQKWQALALQIIDENNNIINKLNKAHSCEEILLSLFFAAGMTRSTEIETFLLMARLPAVCAEAWTRKGASFSDYPSDLPGFRYQQDKSHD